MLLSAVSLLVVAQSSSEIPEGLTNNPVYCVTLHLVGYSLEQKQIHLIIDKRTKSQLQLSLQ